DVRNLCVKARQAQEEFKEFTQEEVDRVVAAMANAGFRESERLAKLAVSETGYGNVPDKTRKNQFCTRDLYESIRDLRTVGVIGEDRKNKILEIAEPMGVVAAIIPTTNPTSTAMFKTIISLKARNGVVISPHPRAANCIKETTNVMIDAAISEGAPEGLIGVIPTSTLQATNELMRHRDTDVILATGGSGLVKAAYSAGKPAYGVGPGNVPAYIDRSADYKKAVADLVAGKSFDYGTLCSSEQAIIVDAPLKNRVVGLLKQQGAYFLNEDEIRMLGRVLVTPEFRINPELVGKPPPVLAKAAGFEVPGGTKVLIAELPGVGRQYPLSAEKLSPTFVFYTANGCEEGARRCTEILNFGGRGHTAVIHAKNDDVIRNFGLHVPAFRVVVNSPASIGAVGYTNNLMPSMTLGCGTYGGNITSDNITAHHLMSIKRVAYETKPLSMPRNGTTWKATIYHDWQHRDASYTKALSSDVSRKGSGAAPVKRDRAEESVEPTGSGKFGSSGMSESEVEQVVEEFMRNKG
nr:aldehyde dehydrogenase family protein [candidate division KSB1 bacterium]NIR69083.1 aldehyde dehydrogenase family protein [candidate division KSB1 bacterium]NIS27363.1 aldehyde dehydrogenase family protein [candidate division KSB1 bacterium]NIT73929.1 aldehyde dehydrogenase family protein [candidate division KSB1 bacterium]NIU28078.1 aldehyde dehydrogenase family protein [candidate division KSB1 bacterium]